MKKYIQIAIYCLALLNCSSYNKYSTIQKQYDFHNDFTTKDLEKILVQSGQTEINNKNYRSAITIYKQLHTLNPDNIIYMLYIADIDKVIGNHNNATYMYNKILAIEKNNTQAIKGKATSLMHKGETKTVIKFLNTYPEIIHNHWELLNVLAISHSINQKPQEAKKYYELALEKSNNNPRIINNIALSMALNNNTKESISLLESIIEKNNISSSLQQHIELNLALIHSLNQNIHKAEEIASKYLNNKELYNNLGIYARIAKNKDLSIAFLNKALSKSSVHYNKAWENLQETQ